MECGIQVSGQLFVLGVARSGQRSYDNQATGGQQGQSFADQMAKPALHCCAHDRSAHGFADNETRTWRGSILPSHVRVRGTAA
ncbi:hypothetical protein AMK22_30915 [Streptomyces sp. CB01580]|nr:hypothetical protein AMK22_30915 [Streptomyces sp. CB01580]